MVLGAARSLVGGMAAKAGGHQHQHQRGATRPQGGSLAEQEGGLKPHAEHGHGHGAHAHGGHGKEAHGHGHEDGAPCAQPAVESAGNGRGPMSADRAQAILTDAFKSYRSFNSKKVHMLPQAQFQTAWDKFYGKTKYAWDVWVKPGPGNLNGFAYGGESYVNSSTANIGTVPHEMLHVHTAPDYMGVCGSPFTEGTTDYLKQYALKKANVSSPNSYANEMKVVQAFVNIAGEDALFTAYLKGGAKRLIADKVDQVCGSWAEVKAASDAKDYARAQMKLRPKSGSQPAQQGAAGTQQGQQGGAQNQQGGQKKMGFFERIASWFKRK